MKANLIALIISTILVIGSFSYIYMIDRDWAIKVAVVVILLIAGPLIITVALLIQIDKEA